MAEEQFGKIQIDRTEEIRNWANKLKEVKHNEKEVKVPHSGKNEVVAIVTRKK